MRAKRSKKYRKLMQQYEHTFGFREPYQVLVDSNFLRQVYSFKMDLIPALERTLQGKVKPMITKCSLATVISSSAGKSNPNPHYRPPHLPPPTVLPLRHCSHNEDSKPIDEVECLLSLLSPNAEVKKNKEHYILATADAGIPGDDGQKNNKQTFTPRNEIKHGARAIPGVPIIYVKRSVMILEPLSGPSENVREGVERGKLRTGVSSTAPTTGKRKRDGDEGEGENAGKTEKKKKERGGKKVSGPNPLSMLKPKAKKFKTAPAPGGGEEAKSTKVDIGAATTEEKNSEGQTENGEPSVKTKRKRRHKSSRRDGDQGPVEDGNGTAMDVES
ncbi:hypothetical protein FQN54_008301 [Arachnomyces sp. PD_36]|nr:hypothetical protein FQN54_008301 [Arachnomyces sp. PD_36]